jgi:hypothetical protein
MKIIDRSKPKHYFKACWKVWKRAFKEDIEFKLDSQALIIHCKYVIKDCPMRKHEKIRYWSILDRMFVKISHTI